LAIGPELTMTAADLEEAAQYLKWTLALEETPPPPEEWAVEPGERTIAPEERHAFAARQLSARRRLYLLRSFYGTCRSRMARMHLLTSAAVVLGRFCGFSATFDAIGDALMPVTDAGAPRTPAWSHYRAACDARKPRGLRDELWVAAHVEDMERVRAEGLDRAFYDEAALHAGNPTYRLMRQHLQMTLDTRLIDHAALAGAVPYEATDLSPLKRLARGGRLLLSAYAAETKRRPGGRVHAAGLERGRLGRRADLSPRRAPGAPGDAGRRERRLATPGDGARRPGERGGAARPRAPLEPGALPHDVDARARHARRALLVLGGDEARGPASLRGEGAGDGRAVPSLRARRRLDAPGA
jgi:hypothetical protein